MNQDKLIEIIELKLQKLEKEWQETKGMILSEDDLKCHLFRLLHEEKEFNERVPTMNPNIFGTRLHTEIKFFNENRELLDRPDITILNPENMSIRHSIEEIEIHRDRLEYRELTTSKGFEFCGKSIVIELKFIKNKCGLTRKDDVELIKADYEKIRRLIQINNNDVKGFVVVFSKAPKPNRNNKNWLEFQKLEEEISELENIKLFFGTGNIEPLTIGRC